MSCTIHKLSNLISKYKEQYYYIYHNATHPVISEGWYFTDGETLAWQHHVLREDLWTPQLFIKVPAPGQEGERSCTLCEWRGLDVCFSLYDYVMNAKLHIVFNILLVSRIVFCENTGDFISKHQIIDAILDSIKN